MSVKSYETILQEALNRIADKYDKREGSIIRDALSPACFLLHEFGVDTDYKLKQGFAGTCDRKWLIERAKEIGMEAPYEASSSVVEAEMLPDTVTVPLGSRFNCDALNFNVTAQNGNGIYELTCETAGEAGNIGSGTLLPIDYIAGLTSSAIRRILIYGEPEQDTEAYREQYFVNVKGDARDGNQKQYAQWLDGFAGVGNYKILPLWNGSCTVKVSILDSNNNPASETLIRECQDYLDPGSTGLGNGVAPIGAVVTVTTASTKEISLTGTITLREGYTAADGLDIAIAEYLRSIAYRKSSVSYMALGTFIFSHEAVENLSELTVNGSTVDITLEDEEIAVFGIAEWRYT